jgi:hypothetical protein
VFLSWRSEFARSVSDGWYDLRLTIRIPLSAVLGESRWSYQQWSELAVAAGIDADRAKVLQPLYRRKSVLGARRFMAEIQAQTRVEYAAVVIGLTTGSVLWGYLTVTAATQGLLYGWTAALFFLVNALVAMPKAYSSQPWRILVLLAAIWALVSMVLGAGNGWPGLDDWMTRPSTTRQALAMATGSVAAFCLLGALLAAIALFTASRLTARRRIRREPDLAALWFAVVLVAWIGPKGKLGNLSDRNWIMKSLELISRSIDLGVPRILGTSSSQAGAVIRSRFTQASRRIRQYQVWVALPQPGTGLALRHELADLVGTLVTGDYHLLPLDEPDANADDFTRLTRAGKFFTELLIACLPLGIVLGCSALKFGIPDYLQQWLVSFTAVWLIVKTLQLLDPNAGRTWVEVNTALQTIRQPGGKS